MSRAACILGLVMLCQIIAGCACPASENNVVPSTTPVFPEAPGPTPVFPRDPVDLQGRLQNSRTLGSFEKNFMASYHCTNMTEPFEANYTFISGDGGPHRIQLQLVPVDNPWDLNEIQMPPQIRSARITPDEFTAQPHYLYMARARVTLDPHVTLEHHETTGGTFFLRVLIDGLPAPDVNDMLSVSQECSDSPPSRYYRADHGIQYVPDEITMDAGDKKGVDLTFWNYGDLGIAELRPRIRGQLISKIHSYPPKTDELRPLTAGMNIVFDPPVTLGRNFRNDTATMIITTDSEVAPGVYIYPLDLCSRGLDLSNPNATHFPFSEEEICFPEGDFSIRVEG